MGKMQLYMLPPLAQILRLKLIRQAFNVLYEPGGIMATASTLSRVSPRGLTTARSTDVLGSFAVAALEAMPATLLVQVTEVRTA